MQSIIRSGGRGAVHVPNTDGAVARYTLCGIALGGWVSTSKVVSCQACISMMAVRVSAGMPHYRERLQIALDAKFVKPPIKSIYAMDEAYSNPEIRWIKEKINELVAVVNALIEEHTKVV